MQQIEPPAADEAFRRIAEDTLRRRARVADTPGRLHESDRIRAVLDQGSKSFLSILELAFDAPLLRQPPKHGFDLPGLERLDQVVEGPRLHGFDRRVDRRVPREDNHLPMGPFGPGGANEFDPVPVGQPKVGQAHLGIELSEGGLALEKSSRCLDDRVVALENPLQPLAGRAVVLHDQNSRPIRSCPDAPLL